MPPHETSATLDAAGVRGVEASADWASVTEPRLYQLIRQHRPVTERTFQITFTDPGVQAYAFTFG